MPAGGGYGDASLPPPPPMPTGVGGGDESPPRAERETREEREERRAREDLRRERQRHVSPRRPRLAPRHTSCLTRSVSHLVVLELGLCRGGML